MFEAAATATTSETADPGLLGVGLGLTLTLLMFRLFNGRPSWPVVLAPLILSFAFYAVVAWAVLRLVAPKAAKRIAARASAFASDVINGAQARLAQMSGRPIHLTPGRRDPDTAPPMPLTNPSGPDGATAAGRASPSNAHRAEGCAPGAFRR